MGTFTANGTIIPPASQPYSNDFGGDLPDYAASITYVLGNSDTIESNNLKWIKLSDDLLVADRNLLCNISWQNIFKNYSSTQHNDSFNSITARNNIIGVPSGTKIIIDNHQYRVRLLSGGKSPGTESEWDVLISLTSGSNNLIHYNRCQSWCYDTSVEGVEGLESGDYYRPARAGLGYWNFYEATRTGNQIGFRPALQLID